MGKRSAWFTVRGLLGRASLAGVVGVLACALAAASPAAAEEVCPNAATRGGPSAELPDCRAYEQVTPEFKNGGEGVPLSLTPGGESLTMSGELVSLLPSTADSIGETHYFTRRTAQGWETVATDPSASEYFARIPADSVEIPYAHTQVGLSLDGEASLWEYGRPGMPREDYDLYLQPTPGGGLVDVGPTIRPEGELAVAGASEDLGDVLLSGRWPVAAAGGGVETVKSLFEYIGTGNAVPLPVGVGENDRLISTCGTALGASGGGSLDQNAVSADGSSVVFTAVACGAALPVNEVYVRVDNGQPGAHTVAISEPSAADCAVCDTATAIRANAEFVGASEDGSKVFFTTEQPLLDGATGENLYEYDFDAPAGERVVLVSAGGEFAPQLQGVASVSEDGSRVYFTARGVLSTAPNGEGQVAEQGAENLYVFDTDTGQLAFVVAAPAGELPIVFGGPAPVDDFEATPDGRFLVFGSVADLTPDDTSSATQLFEYDALSGRLARVSVGQDGYNDDGNTGVYGAEIAHSAAHDASPAEYARHLSVTEEGTVFFQSQDALTPQATPGERQVYEYENGEVHLIAGGVESHTQLIGTDESGGDVFFESSLGLVQSDLNNSADIYDARVDGGFSFYVPPECAGEECQGQLSGTPVLLSPGSEFQVGGGNLSPPAVKAVKAPKKKVKAKRAKKRKKRRGAGKKGHRAKRSSTASRGRLGKGRM